MYYFKVSNWSFIEVKYTVYIANKKSYYKYYSQKTILYKDLYSQTNLEYLKEKLVTFFPRVSRSDASPPPLPILKLSSQVSGVLYCSFSHLGKKHAKTKLHSPNADRKKNGKNWLKGNPKASGLPTPLTLDKLHENILPLMVGESNLKTNSTTDQ